jgi:S1-C subfamily serine protease
MEGISVDPPLDSVSRDTFVRLHVDGIGPTGGREVRSRDGDSPSVTRDLPDLVESTSPAVMHIDTDTGLGSGFAVDPDGFLLTNAHVVDPSGSHVVRLSDGSTYAAELVGHDASTDLAVLSIPPTDLPALTFRALKTVRVGEAVVAVGSPLGLSWTVTAGIVSGLERTITAPDGQQIDYVVQTDAQINPGNSGGPLIDRHGLVVGVNAQGVAPGVGSGVGFAIPSDTACSVYEEIREHGEVVRGAIGARAVSRPFLANRPTRSGKMAARSSRPSEPTARLPRPACERVTSCSRSTASWLTSRGTSFGC